MSPWFGLMAVAALALVDGGEGLLGSELRQDGFSLRPPRGFRMARMGLFQGTQAGAVGEGEGRFLSAALVDGSGAEAASMLVSVVEGGFSATPAGRDEISAQVLRHFGEELSLKFAMERAELHGSPAPRIEVLGTVRAEDQVRHVLVAALAGQGRHAVVTFSVPSGRWEALFPALRASLESFRSEQLSSETSREVVGAVALLFAAALLTSLALRRRRRAAGD